MPPRHFRAQKRPSATSRQSSGTESNHKSPRNRALHIRPNPHVPMTNARMHAPQKTKQICQPRRTYVWTSLMRIFMLFLPNFSCSVLYE